MIEILRWLDILMRAALGERRDWPWRTWLSGDNWECFRGRMEARG
jgi:hypothetical protein